LSVKTVIAVLVASVAAIVGFSLVLVFGAQIAGNASLYGSLSASNVTKITTNVGNGVVTGSTFFPLIFLGSAASFVLGILGLVFVALKTFHAGGKGD